MLVPLAVSLAVLSIGWIFYRLLAILAHQRKMNRIIGDMPGLPALPIIGNAHQFNGTSDQRAEKFRQIVFDILGQGSNVMRTWVLGKLYVAPLTGETVKVLLDNNVEISKGSDYDLLIPWLGTGLLISTGSKWRSRRRLLTPTFHFSMLEGYIATFNAQSKVSEENITLPHPIMSSLT